jgi:hypothetical protein
LSDSTDHAHRERLKQAAGFVLDLVQRLPRELVPGLTTEEAAHCLETAAKVVRQTEGWPAFLALDADAFARALDEFRK